MAYISHHSELSLSKILSYEFYLSENILYYNLNDAQEAKAKNYKK